MSNTRIKDVPGFDGLKAEAIASNLNFEYDPANPMASRITFAYKDYITDDSGVATPYSDGKYDTMGFVLEDILHWDLGNGATPLTAVELLRAATDVAHNERYGNAGGST